MQQIEHKSIDLLEDLALVAENTDNIIVLTDPQGEITWVNQGFINLTEYTLEEVLGKKPGSFLQGPGTDSNTIAEIRRAIKNAESITCEVLNYSKSGKPYWMHMNIQPVFDHHKNLKSFMAIQVDITQRKENERKIQNYSEELNKALNTKDKFFSILAHDLKSPFQNLIGSAKLITEARDELSNEDIFNLVETIKESAENTYSLLENLLEWSRSQTGDIKVARRLLLLNNFFQELDAQLAPEAARKNIILQFSCQGQVFVFADFNMLTTVFRNLVSNAIKFTPRNGQVKIHAENENGKVKITVQDSGVGMSEEVLQNLFSSDKKTSRDGTEGEKGTGLGLLIVHDFIKMNQGTILAESQPGEGTTFIITLLEKPF